MYTDSSSSNAKPSRQPHKTNTKSTLLNGHAPSTTKKKSKRMTTDLDISLSDSDLDISSALLPISSDSDSDLTSIQMNTNSLRGKLSPRRAIVGI